MRLVKSFKRIFRTFGGNKSFIADSGSIAITDKKVIERFVNNRDNCFLISFPRTGSHWLRMIMELYFERPSLVRVFFFPARKDYLTLHSHDLELDVERENVIYLYREPVDTIYSQINYHEESLDDIDRIKYWANLYGCHLDKWLYRENFTCKKTILTYEGMKRDLANEFEKVTQHFQDALDVARLEDVAKKVTKANVKQKTAHDPQVIRLKESYNILREEFRMKHSDLIWEVLTRGRLHLLEYFDDALLPTNRGSMR